MTPRFYPSAFPLGQTVPTIAVNPNRVSDAVRYYQRLLLGVGFSPGPQGADGRMGSNSANAVQAFARWYNGLPEGAMTSPQDLKRGAIIAVDRDLTPEKQTALQRFEARASDQLSSLQQTTIVQPGVPVEPRIVERRVEVQAISWGKVAALGLGAVAIGVVVGLSVQKKKKAQ
jgi:peptidoglycan hydrolase-like protein with peptidoglycan-binding domain